MICEILRWPATFLARMAPKAFKFDESHSIDNLVPPSILIQLLQPGVKELKNQVLVVVCSQAAIYLSRDLVG